MGTDRRARQKELHRAQTSVRRQELARLRRRQRIVTLASGLALITAAAAVLWWISDRDGITDDVAATSTTLAAPPTTATAPSGPSGAPPSTTQKAGTAPCPKADGSSSRTTTFDGPPPVCITPGKKYTATFETSKGSFTASLDSTAAPLGVNNFVFLSRYHAYDGVPFHRIVPDFVIQSGDVDGSPDGSNPTLGYSIAEEPPASGKYAKYDLAMAKTNEPNSTGSQFFVVTGKTDPLDALRTYTRLGSVTEGREVVDAIGATPVQGETPTETVTVNKVTITEA